MNRRPMLACLLLAAAAAAAPPRISFSAAGEPLRVVLQTVAEQAGLELDAPPELLERTITLSLARVPLEVALDQIATRTKLDLTVADGKLVVRAAATPAPPPDLLPPLAQPGLALLRAALETGALADREAFAAWLRRLRPDLRDSLPRPLSDAVLAGGREPERCHRLTEVWLAASYFEEAARVAGLLRRDEASEAAAWALLAQIELQVQDPESAVRMARRAVELEPESGLATATLITAIYFAGRVDEALAEGYAAAARMPNEPAVLAAVGDVLRRRRPDNAGAAADWMQRALAIEPRLPDALYGLAVIAGGAGEDDAALWREFLAVEGSSVRAQRARLHLAAAQTVNLSERGGVPWDLTADGERVLYADPFRKQLQITDTSGFGLAIQVTDQEANKTWATLSPGEEYLAWLVEGRTTQLYLQNQHQSGAHRLLLESPRGRAFRRTAWSPDGDLLVVTERGGEEPVKLHAWSIAADREVPPPEPLASLDGLGDVAWVRPDLIVGTVTRAGRSAPVAVTTDGTIYLLRPPQRSTFAAPSLDPVLWRVAYRDRAGQLVGAPADASAGTEVPLLAASSGKGTEYGIFTRDGHGFVTSLRGIYPVVLALVGLEPGWLVRVRTEPLLASGPTPTSYTFELTNALDEPLAGELRAALVDSAGTETWTTTAPLAAPLAGTASVTVRPPATFPGEYWLRVDLTANGRVDEPRWYRYEVTPPA